MKIPIIFIFIAFLTTSCSHLSLISLKMRDLAGYKTIRSQLKVGQKRIISLKERQRWHLNKTKAEQAWQLSRGDKNIVVAIIDTGIDMDHPDLKDNLWVNQREKNGKIGVDDDNNGYVDDIHGWNYVNNSPDVTDHLGHGTHVAGIIGGKGHICKPGVAPQVSLMILKYYNPSASGAVNLKNTIKSIRYATDNGAHIINFSGGGFDPNEEERAAIQLAGAEKQVLFVTAAGNDRTDVDATRKLFYPASYRLPNILSVAASIKNDKSASFSNSGGKSINIHAPGSKIYSTLPGGECGYLTGTSQATPLVAGGAVLVKAYKKSVNTPKQIADYIEKTVDRVQSLIGKNSSGGRANFLNALSSEKINVMSNGSEVENTSSDSMSDEQKNMQQLFQQLKYSEQHYNSSKEQGRGISSIPTESNEFVDPSVWSSLLLQKLYKSDKNP